MIRSILNWINLVFFKKNYSVETILRTSKDFSEVWGGFVEIFKGEYISDLYSLHEESDYFYIEKNKSGFWFNSLFDFKQIITIKAYSENEVIIKTESRYSYETGLFMVFGKVASLIAILIIYIILFVWIFTSFSWDKVVFLIMPWLLGFSGYTFYSNTIAALEFYHFMTEKTINGLGENKPMSILRGIWS